MLQRSIKGELWEDAEEIACLLGKYFQYITRNSQELVPLQDEYDLPAALEDSFSVDLKQPVYLMYTLITGSYYNKKLYSYDNILTYLETVTNLLCGKFHFSMLEINENVMLWFFQDCRTTKGEHTISAINFLKNISEDLILSIEDSLRCTVINTLYEDEVRPEHISHIAKLLHEYNSEQLRQNAQHASSSMVISTKQLEKVTAAHHSPKQVDSKTAVQELLFYLNQKNKGAFMNLLHTLSAQCSSCQSMHDLSVLAIYFSIATLFIRYIGRYNLEKQLSLKIALYPLYYIHDFPDWKSAFRYLTTLSGHLFAAISETESSSNEYLIQTIERYIAENISRSLSLSDVASSVNYNATYVSRLYKQQRGTSLSEYITQVRLNKATELLLTTNESIQNIARETGFDTSQYFSMVFKKSRGVSPRDFRNLHLG